MAVLTPREIEIINNISPGADQVGLGDLMENALSGILPAGSVALSELAMAATGQVIRSNGVASANTWSTISAGAPAFTGTPATISPTAVLAAAPVFTGSAMGTHQHDAISAGTPAGTNAVSDVTPVEGLLDMDGITLPTLSLVHNADPVGGLAAAALYAVVDTGTLARNARLESNQASTASTKFTTANTGAVYGTTGLRATGWVKHNLAPGGVALFVDEADGYKIKANFGTGDAYITLNMGSYGFIDIKVIDADTAGMKALYYDDNGADNAKFCFIATDTASHDTGSAFSKVQLGGFVTGMRCGQAAAQVFSGSAMGTHQHAAVSAGTPAGTNDAPAITVTGAGYTPAGTVAAPAISLS